MNLSDLISAMQQIAPTHLAEPWDNVGLIVGDPQQPLSGVMLTIDYTREVASEAQSAGCDAVVSYHPPIFDALKRIVAPSLIHDAIRRGVAIYSPHTALDVADGGTNDMLADVLGLIDRQPLRLSEPKAAQCKLVVFVPEDAVEKVSSALFEGGAGRIGNYTCCSFRSAGTGTFFGQEGSSPAVGEANRLERVNELRLETVLPIDRVQPAISALRASHPYEEPAFDLMQLVARPEGKGQGRIGALPPDADRAQLIARIKRELGLKSLLVAGPTSGAISRAAVCAGGCGNMIDDALDQGAGLYLTGEVRHHDALKAAQRGMTVVCALHSNSERKVLERLSHRLRELLPSVPIQISRTDRDPFAVL